MSHKVTLIPGDGTGPEICETALKVIEATGAKIDWEIENAGADIASEKGTPLPSSVLESIRRNKVALKGPLTTPIGMGFRSVNVAIRKELDLFACFRPCITYQGIRSKFEDINLVVIRENTEDLYAGIEFAKDSPESQEIIRLAESCGTGQLSQNKIAPHSAISIKSISEEASLRIVKFAFEYALTNSRRKVTAVSKANIMKTTDGLFLEASRKIAAEYSGKVEYEEKLIDNICMQLVQKPNNYDVLVLPNLYGDIASDLCAGLVGGLGMAPGANFGEDIAVFEAVHGSAPKYKGLNKVNPCALILSAKYMLEYLGETTAAFRLEKAVRSVVSERKKVTYDLGGYSGTKEMGEAIIDKLQAKSSGVKTIRSAPLKN
ncbi:MAG: isocitrate/isopropylmalate dehydrogenase family protein [Elusimicrobiota bacterium]|jgi:isocitrate dehydrogenase (NAD+)|nr:isocitrate/isopropylmalate dehydrogenase family protein [Elusimicrobiota bacterium]